MVERTDTNETNQQVIPRLWIKARAVQTAEDNLTCKTQMASVCHCLCTCPPAGPLLHHSSFRVRILSSFLSLFSLLFFLSRLGLGAQSLYQVTVSFAASTNVPAITATRTVGFRVFALVTVDDSNPAQYVNGDGSGNLTMRFKVNGADVSC